MFEELILEALVKDQATVLSLCELDEQVGTSLSLLNIKLTLYSETKSKKAILFMKTWNFDSNKLQHLITI